MEIEAPDGTVVEFPDGTPPETIKQVMRKQFGGPEAAPAQPARMEVPFQRPPGAVDAPVPPRRQESPLETATRYAGGAQKALLEGMLQGARGEVLGGLDTLAGRGTMEENLARRDAELDAVPSEVRLPAEVLGGVSTLAAGGPVNNILARTLLPGGVYGYNASKGSPTERLPGAALGAGAGLLGEGLIRALARVVSPKSSPQVQTLMNEGVTPTPGQALGGVARSTEEKLSSVPFLGDAIRSGERRAMEQFNTGAINRALREAGLSLPKGTAAGTDATIAAHRIINEGYDDVFRGSVVGLDSQFGDDLAKVAQRAQQELNDQGRAVVTREISKFTTLPEMKNNQISGRTAKEVLSALRTRARQFGSSADAYTQDVGKVLGDLAESFNSLLKRSLPTDKAARYTGLDKAFKELLRPENAAARAGGDAGTFTPAQLSAASRQMDQSLRKGATARGQAVGQEFAEAGRQVLGNNVPNSGTADRGLLTLLAGSGAGYAYDPLLGAGIAAGIGGPSLVYTPLMQRIMANLITGRQGAGSKAAADSLRAVAPAVGLGGAISTSR